MSLTGWLLNLLTQQVTTIFKKAHVSHTPRHFFCKILPPPLPKSDDDCIPACAEFEKIRKMSRLETLQGYV